MTIQTAGSKLILDTRPVVEVAEKLADVLTEFGVIGGGPTDLHNRIERRAFIGGLIGGANDPSIEYSYSYYEYTATYAPVRLLVDYTLDGSEVRVNSVLAVDHPYDNGKIDWVALNAALTDAF